MAFYKPVHKKISGKYYPQAKPWCAELYVKN